MNKSNTILLIILSLISSYSLMGCFDNENNGEDFKFQALDGSEIYLSDYRGKIVIVDMWATWCSPCGYQMLELEKVYNNYNRDYIEIISLNIDNRETVTMVKDYIDEFERYNIFLDWVFGMDTDDAWEKYKIDGGIPTLYIFDKNGEIHYYHEGVSVFSEIPSGWPKNTITLKDKIDELI
jgi:thiol-disulfide isomerase/thioredoxin